jgi:small subunit ribosomal protein S6
MAAPREYETVYIFGSDVDDAEKTRVAERVDGVIARFNGELKRRDEWGRRRLSYKIGKYERGIYVYVRYLVTGDAVAELERNLRLIDSVIKFITVRLEDGAGEGARPSADNEEAPRRERPPRIVEEEQAEGETAEA